MMKICRRLLLLGVNKGVQIEVCSEISYAPLHDLNVSELASSNFTPHREGMVKVFLKGMA